MNGFQDTDAEVLMPGSRERHCCLPQKPPVVQFIRIAIMDNTITQSLDGAVKLRLFQSKPFTTEGDFERQTFIG